MKKRISKLIAAALVLSALLTLFAGCSHRNEEVVVYIPEREDTLPRAHTPEPSQSDDTAEPTQIMTEAPTAEPTEEPTAPPTATPAPVEERVLSGTVYALNGGKEVGKKYEGESIDIDGDGVKELLEVKKADGMYSFCIDGKPFMADGQKIWLASPDGNRIMFAAESANGGFNLFYPDEDGNLFCRLYAVCRTGSVEDLSPAASYEESIRNGVDIMLFNPAVYSGVSGAERTIKLDMDGDGVKDEIVFDSNKVSINGQEDTELPLTTMPRFAYDAEKDTIILLGTSGGDAVTLRLENGKLVSETKHVDLL